MPSPKRKSTARQLIQEAIGHLRRGGPARPDLADAVADLAAQRYRGFEGTTGTTVPFRADRELLARVGKGRINEVARSGCERFLAGDLQPARTVRGPAEQKTHTSVLIDPDLLARVNARCAEVSAELGWTVKPVNVFVAAFEQDAPATE